MSGIAGILHLDGRPVAIGDLTAMTQTMAHRGPDGIHHRTSGAVGLAHCMLRTTPQSLAESQPLESQAGELSLTMDGRVDNRDELLLALGGARGASCEVSDAELVLRCYERWGVDCIGRIIGDFAFALWDGRRRKLVCARDFLGKRPFYYSCSRSSFRFASEPQAVLVDPSVPREPNEGMVGEMLAVRPRSTNETLFRHLFRLPPAHFLVVTPDGVRVKRYWDWDPGLQIVDRSDKDYADHLLDVLASAVDASLSSPWPVALSLSGGIDSSSIVGAVEHLRRHGRYDGSLEVFSLVPPGPVCDDAAHMRAVAEQHRLQVHEFPPMPVAAAAYEAQASRYLDLPDYRMTMVHRPYWASARARGCRVLVSGKGGDEWLTGSYFSLADRLRRLRVRRLVRDIRTDAASSGLPAIRGHLWGHGVKPMLPPAVVAGVRAALGRKRSSPTFLRTDFCRAIDLEERLSVPAPRSATADVARSLSDGWQPHGNEMVERALASVGLEGRDPFDDRRMVEFALGLPEEQRRRGGVTKYVLREAMTGLIPETVRLRRDKGHFSHLTYEEWRLQGGRSLFADLELARMGWVDAHQVLAMYDHLEGNYLHGHSAYLQHLWPLSLILSMDRWVSASV